MTRIYFERTGGFAGLRLSTSVDTQSLDELEASRLEQEIEQANFFHLPARLQTPSGGADRFEYQIALEQGIRKHTVIVGEASLPDALRPLVEHLELLMRTRR
ncbi:MAG: hypothetical protein IH586_07745 [Anaerolineaceae bacterium]|nr:hypothetical protein [Anaerolineaceae bacterium]